MFFFNATATPDIYTLSLHDALPIYTYKQSRHDIDSTNNGKIVSNTLKSPAHHATQNWISIKVWKPTGQDRKSTRLNSSHTVISYAVFCLKKKKTTKKNQNTEQNKNE